MFVKDPFVVDGIRGYVSYNLTGPKITTQGATRRYSDFYALREYLVKSWKGFYIPGIPPKKLVGKTEKDTTNMRCRLLNNFLRRISSIPHLSQSKEVQAFMDNKSGEIQKVLDKLPKKDYEQLYDTLKKIYPNFKMNYDHIVGKSRLFNFQNLIEKLEASFKVIYINIFNRNLILQFRILCLIRKMRQIQVVN